jgi:tRNA-2-methylthio-N6-dimethylallyladenosine synthase
MNVHDSEHIAGVLERAGYVPVDEAAARREAAAALEADHTSLPAADVVVLNTCAVREAAATRLYGNLGQLAQVKAAHPGMLIAVGGCLAQKDRDHVIAHAPDVDAVFGTHNIGALPELLEAARQTGRPQVRIAERLEQFPSDLPARRADAYSAWVSISVGCNNTCTYCIVPSLRGQERDRRPGDILEEVRRAVAGGAVEVTLLGQNVNTYGVSFGDRTAFSKLLRAAGATPGLERLRFTSPHPAAFTPDVIAAMAETPAVCPSLHMPLQSGSDRVLRAMRRSYRSARFLDVLAQVRDAIPEAAITTDVIVGFPGETEQDFAATLEVVERARFASAFTFRYSPRPGTPAAERTDQVPPDVVQDRYRRLTALQERVSEEENRAQVGRRVEVLVATGEGRKDAATGRLSGRARDGRLVHFSVPDDVPSPFAENVPDDGPSPARGADRSGAAPRPGDLVTCVVTASAPHHLIADSALGGGTFSVRRTPGGDAWERATAGDRAR